MSPQNNKFTLDNLKKQNPFQVPENYFDSLGARISGKIEAQTHKEKEAAFGSLKAKPALLFAGGLASIAIIAYLGISLFFSGSGNTKLTASDIATLTEYSIASELDEATLLETFSSEVSSAPDTSAVNNKENIIDYIKDDIDISTIIDEL